MDQLVKATAGAVRMYAAVTTDLAAEAACRHECGALGAAAIGRVMTGALLLAANLKNKEAVTVSFGGDGALGRVTADATPEGYVRGYAQHPRAELPLNDGKLAVGAGIGRGMLTVTRFTGLKDPVSGSVEIESGEVAEDITRYLYYSEQTPSAVGLGVLVNKDLTVRAAGGYIIQPLPEAGDDVIDKLEANIAKARSVSDMVDSGMGPREIIAALLDGFGEIEYLTTTDLSFRCRCSRRRTEDMLISLRKADRLALIEDGRAEVCCQFCGEKYQFTKDDLMMFDRVADEVARRRAAGGLKETD